MYFLTTFTQIFFGIKYFSFLAATINDAMTQLNVVNDLNVQFQVLFSTMSIHGISWQLSFSSSSDSDIVVWPGRWLGLLYTTHLDSISLPPNTVFIFYTAPGYFRGSCGFIYYLLSTHQIIQSSSSIEFGFQSFKLIGYYTTLGERHTIHIFNQMIRDSSVLK